MTDGHVDDGSTAGAGRDLPPHLALRRLLSRSGTCEVWLADDASRGTPVAVKMVRARPDPGAPPGAIDAASHRLAAEAERLGALRHPSIVALYEALPPMERPDVPGAAGAGGAASALLLEALTGGSLASRLRGGAPAAICAALRPIVGALAYLHGHNLVHGDLSPGNVLLDAHGAAKLCDFDRAQATGSAWRCGDVGPPERAYLSPQQVAGSPATPADDIYGLGALLYELLAGVPPLGTAPSDAAIRDVRPDPLAALVPGLDPALAALIDRMLAKHPAARPPSLLRDVGGVIDGVLCVGRAGDAALGTARAAREVSAASPDAPAPDGHGTARARVAPSAFAAPSGEPAPATARSAPPSPPVGDLVAGRRPAPALAPPLLARVPPGVMAGGAALLVAVLAFLLAIPRLSAPSRESERELREAALAAARAAASPDGAGTPADAGAGETGAGAAAADPLTLARQRRAAQRVIGDLVAEQETLERAGGAAWGGADWAAALEVQRAGDLRHQARDYAASIVLYEDALSRMRAVGLRRAEQQRQAREAGVAALEAGDQLEALRQLALALEIDPSDAVAQRGSERAQTLGEVIAAVERGEALEAAGDMAPAREAFADATRLDPDWRSARNGLARIDARLADQSYSDVLSRGFDALYRGELDAAEAEFQRARKLRPDAADAATGLAQVAEARDRTSIDRQLATALRALREERYADAVAAYEAALAVDAELVKAQEGLAGARERAALLAKMEFLIASPERLYARPVRSEAAALVSDIAQLEPPSRVLGERAQALTALIDISARPVPVVLESDNQTDIVLYRVGRLGAFLTREIALEPGEYTVVGSRDGYRDVRQTFTVTPGAPTRVVVVAEEAI
jgi:hypothetical protein